MTDTSNSGKARRDFLMTSANAGLLGAALALLSRTAPIQAAQQLPAAKDEPTPSGYHETEHIRKYYAKARQF